MAHNNYLQLYLDTDYILPIAVGVDGNLVKYVNNEGECQLWLYFSKSASSDAYESGSAQKSNFEAGFSIIFGKKKKKISNGETVASEPFGYIDLLEVSGLLGYLRDWCKAVLGTPTPFVVLNFATTIGVKARREFVDYLTKKDFNVHSYSIEINNLIAEKIVHDHRTTMQCSFGDQLLILQSTGRVLLLSTLTWCGDSFQQGEKAVDLPTKGDDFLKTAMATMVVEKAERRYNMLNATEISAEIAYQEQFTSKWLTQREGDDIIITGFHYSRNPRKIYTSFSVSASQLGLLVEQDSHTTIERIANYYRQHIVNHHLHTVFLGDMFRNEQFVRNCAEVTSSIGKYTFMNGNALQEAMGRYYFSYGNAVEPIEELEQRYLTLEQERERIRKYVRNAETLGGLRNTIEDSFAEMRTAIDNVKSRTKRIEDSWTAYMQQSKFDAAEAILSEMSSDDALTRAKSRLHDSLVKIEANKSLLEDLKQLNEIHVKEIVEEILKGYKQLQQLQKEAKDLEIRPKELKDRTQHYREAYGTYLEIKRRLDKEQSMGGKKRVLEELKDKDLTMEPLPEVNVKPVNAEFICSIESSGGGLFKKKKYSLNVTLQVKDGDVLPFPCVIMIANSNKVTLDRNDWCADVNAGESQWSNTISIDELPKGDKFVVHLFPDEKNSFKRTSLYCESKQVKIK